MASITRKAEGPQTDPQGSTGSSDGESCLEYSADEGRVDRARKAELRPDVLRDMADTFKVLSHPTRLRILRALSEEELCVCELAELLDLSMSATSHQLRALRDRRLVDYRMDGRFAYYRLSDPFLASVLAQGVEHMSRSTGSP
jgi:DNA-binding transcriptional ArsR family regulator